jgi:hypothetical protein
MLLMTEHNRMTVFWLAAPIRFGDFHTFDVTNWLRPPLHRETGEPENAA